jgi:hypothetical protein
MQHEQSFKNTNIDVATQRGKRDTPKNYNLNKIKLQNKIMQHVLTKHYPTIEKPSYPYHPRKHHPAYTQKYITTLKHFTTNIPSQSLTSQTCYKTTS